MKNVLKRIGILMLALSLSVAGSGFLSLADYTISNELIGNSDTSFSEEVLSDSHLVETDYSLMATEIASEKREYVQSFNVLATSSNSINIIATVTNEEELKSAVARANEGDSIEIANDISIRSEIVVDKSLTFIAADNVERIRIFMGNANGFRHFYVSGKEIYLRFENIILDGNHIGGGIYSQAEHLVVAGVTIQHGNNGISADGKLTLIGSEIARNGNMNSFGSGGGIYAWSDLIIINSRIIGNENYNAGGIYSTRNVTIINSIISNNHARAYGGGLWSWPSDQDNCEYEIIIYDCEFTLNSAREGGALVLYGETTNYFIESKFAENTAESCAGAIYISKIEPYSYILNCEILDNHVTGINAVYSGGGLVVGLHTDSGLLLIDGTKINGNTVHGTGGGIRIYNTPRAPESKDQIVISNSEIMHNENTCETIHGTMHGKGGGIYIDAKALDLLKICNNSIIKDNYADKSFLLTNEFMISVHKQQIDSTVKWSEGFHYMYNNLDVVGPEDVYYSVENIKIVETYGDNQIINNYQVFRWRGFRFHFVTPEGCDAIIESNANLEIDWENETIDIESVEDDITIKIIYEPIEKEDEHTVTIITHYLDGVHMDESKSYQVQKGTSFQEHYDMLEGYVFAGMNIRSSYPEIDINTQTIYIDSVAEDYIITINLTRKKLNVQITTQYMDGVLPDETKSYQVLYGDDFAERYDALEGYVFAGMSIRSYPYVDISNGMVCIDEVTEDYHIVVKLRRAEYKVKITVEYEGSDLENQVSTYTVLHGDSFREQFEIAEGYGIAIIKAEKGIDLDYFMQMVEIENVTKDMNVTIVCR